VSRRRTVVAAVAAVAVLAMILVLSNPEENRYDRPPLDPRGTGPGGVAALVELLRAEGAQVRIGGTPDERDDVVLQLRDTFSGEAADGLRRWLRTGGTLVTADPYGGYIDSTMPTQRTALEPGACELTAIRDDVRLDPGLPTSLTPAPNSSECFTSADGAGLTVTRAGAGLVVALSSSVTFTNEVLGRADNAVLATVLLVPNRGVRIRVLDPNRYVSDDEVGDGTVLGALPLRGSQAVTQAVIAFLAVALIRGRRLGRPVDEDLPVPLPAADLVLASGHLLDRNDDATDAAERLRRRARRDLGVATGLGADPHPGELLTLLRDRAGLDRDLIERALVHPVRDRGDLVAVSADLDRLRTELFR